MTEKTNPGNNGKDKRLFAISVGAAILSLFVSASVAFAQQPATPWTGSGGDVTDAQLKPAQSLPAGTPVTVTETTTTTTTGTTTTTDKSIELTAHKVHNKLRKDQFIAWKMARDPYFYETAQADPSMVAVVCAHRNTATWLAKNRHLDRVADADPLLCRRLTKWHSSAVALVQNPWCRHVIALDPEGLYTVVNRYPGIAGILASNQMFNELVAENPEIGRFISLHMH
jgi:hypothetical protein